MSTTAKTGPAASIIIPTLGRAGYLEHTLRSLIAQRVEGNGFEVIVAHDGDDPAIAALVERFDREAGAVRYLPRAGSSGPNAARNRGFAAAGSDALVLIDDDVEAPAGWLAAIVGALERNPDFDVIGGPVDLRLEGFRLRTCGREPPPLSSLDLGPEPREVPAVWSGNMVLRRSALEVAGPFSEGAIYGQEEVEWQRRLRAGGGRVLYEPSVRLIHRRAPRDARLGPLLRESYRRGRQLRASDHAEGRRRPLPRELRDLAGCASHIVRYRCANGILLTAHSLGRTVEAVRGG
jgi:glycosyltransferase involved in cell wall biosynthesis